MNIKSLVTIGKTVITVTRFYDFSNPRWVQTQSVINKNQLVVSLFNRDNDQELRDIVNVVAVWHVKPKYVKALNPIYKSSI